MFDINHGEANFGPWVLSAEQDVYEVSLIPGNLSLLGVIRGTTFFLMRDDHIVLAIEWCSNAREGLDLPMFVREAVALLQVFKEHGVVIHGLLIGRFEGVAKIGKTELEAVHSLLVELSLIDKLAPR
jgi:hypothetical protein